MTSAQAHMPTYCPVCTTSQDNLRVSSLKCVSHTIFRFRLSIGPVPCKRRDSHHQRSALVFESKYVALWRMFLWLIFYTDAHSEEALEMDAMIKHISENNSIICRDGKFVV